MNQVDMQNAAEVEAVKDKIKLAATDGAVKGTTPADGTRDAPEVASAVVPTKEATKEATATVASEVKTPVVEDATSTATKSASKAVVVPSAPVLQTDSPKKAPMAQLDSHSPSQSQPSTSTAAAAAAAAVVALGDGAPSTPSSIRSRGAGAGGSNSSPLSSASNNSGNESHTLLSWIRHLAENFVPLDSPCYEPRNPGLLLSDTTTKPLYFNPFALVWVADKGSRTKREQQQDLPDIYRSFPLLPHWTFQSQADNECVPRSLLLSDPSFVSVSPEEVGEVVEGPTEWIQQMLELDRDAFTGIVRGKSGVGTQLEIEYTILSKYRQM